MFLFIKLDNVGMIIITFKEVTQHVKYLNHSPKYYLQIQKVNRFICLDNFPKVKSKLETMQLQYQFNK